METDEEGRDTASATSRAPSAGVAPGPAMLLAILGVMILPILLACALPHLPVVVRGYLPALPLPLLGVEMALAFALFALPAFAAPRPKEASPLLLGITRGLFIAVMALPFALASRAVLPVPPGAILAGCALVAATGAGAAAATAAFGARGFAAAVCAVALPGLIGFFGPALELPVGWLGTLCPFLAAETAVRGGAAWTLGLLPGVALLAAGGALRDRQGRACPPAENN